MTRHELLVASLFPVMQNLREWEKHPEEFAYGTDMNRMVAEFKKGYKVTPEEWTALEAEYAAHHE